MLLRQTPNSSRRAAFTLMEMLIVVAIIVALAGISGFYLMGALFSSQEDAARLQVTGPLTTAVQAYAIKHQGTYPTQLADLLQKDQAGNGPYLDRQDALIDPWGQQYQYDPSGPNNNGLKPDIWTVEKKSGKKIGNWDKSINAR